MDNRRPLFMKTPEKANVPDIEERLASIRNYLGVRFDSETVRQRMGLPTGCYLFNSNASVDNLRRFADGLGDLNPRFRDADYARRTRYGRLVASPMFLATVCTPAAGVTETEIAGARGFHSGSEWEFSRPVLEGDKLDFYGIKVADVAVRESKFSGQMIVVSSLVQYKNQRGEIMATARGFVHRSASDEEASQMGKYTTIAEPYKYSDDEVRKIQEDRGNEEDMRGSRPRYWEDVQEGDSIGYIVLGPFSIMDCIAYAAGGNGGRGARFRSKLGKPPSNLTCYDPRLNLFVDPMLQHLDEYLARSVGAPGSFDGGIERECRGSVLFTNWMGDDGFLWKYTSQFRGFVSYGDICWHRGKITKKYVERDRYCVDIEHWVDNQRGVTVTTGKATVILPTKSHGPLVYPEPRSLEDHAREG
jgi:acyl dehydratase